MVEIYTCDMFASLCLKCHMALVYFYPAGLPPEVNFSEQCILESLLLQCGSVKILSTNSNSLTEVQAQEAIFNPPPLPSHPP